MIIRSIHRTVWMLVFGVMLPLYVWGSPEYRGVTILHTNDTHGHLIPFNLPDSLGPTDESVNIRYRQNVGGIARRATLVRRIESEYYQGNVLLVDAGDALDGTPFSVEYMGEADFTAMSVAGYDLMTPGNHEFSATFEEWWRNLRTATFPMVSANIVDRRTGSLAFPAFRIFDFQGAKIAFFGLTVPSSAYRAAKEGFDFKDPIETAKELVPKLREQADIVIALTHIGIEEDERLAKEVAGIDVIVGGHSHSKLSYPKFISHSSELHAFWIGGTVIVQDYCWGVELGRLDLRLRRNGGPFKLMSYSWQTLPVTADLPEDVETSKIVERFYRPIASYYGKVLGEARETFYNVEPENTALNLVCDAMRETSGTQIAVYNAGGVRECLVRGEVKVWDIACMLPFRNKLVEIKVTGEQLRRALETEPLGVSGMTYRLRNGTLVEAFVGDKPLDESAVYTLAISDFLLSGIFSGVEIERVLKKDYREAVVEYIRSQKIISPVRDGRRIIE